MKHILEKPFYIVVPKPQVFLAALLAAIFSDIFKDYAVRWHYNPFWAYLAAALAGIWLSHLVGLAVLWLRRRNP